MKKKISYDESSTEHVPFWRKVRFYLLTFILILVISLPLLFSFFRSGYFPTHDGEWAVVRLADMYRTIRDIQIPARYSGYLNFGYGYPLFNFAYPMPYYFGTVLVIGGLGFVNSIKALFIISTILSAYFMFIASRHVWKSTYAGIISAVLYLYFPYRIVDLYVRGSIGEIMAFIFFPLIILSISELSEKSRPVFYISLLAISTALLITTHNIMSVLFLFILFAFTVTHILYKKKKVTIPVMTGLLLGVGLSAFFLIPALLEKGNIILSRIPIADRNLYFVEPMQFIHSNFGYGTPTGTDPFTYQIGIPHIMILLLTTGVVIFQLRRKQVNFYTKVASVLIGLICIFIIMMMSISQVIWKIPLLSEINYPWTLLSQVGFAIALLSGYLATMKKYLLYITLAIAVVSIVLYTPYAKPFEFIDRGDNYYVTNDATTTSSTELLPIWVNKKPLAASEEKIKLSEGTIENLIAKSNKIQFIANTPVSGTIYINTIYYPGWKVFVDNTNTAINYDNEMGVIGINIPVGRHTVEARFEETPLRMLANFVSVISVGLLILLYIQRKRVQKYFI